MISQKEWIIQFKQKDYSQFQAFYEQTNRKVFYTVIQILKSEVLAEDVIQETYMKFLKHIERVDENKNIDAYLLKIARNLAIDTYHQRKHIVLEDTYVYDVKDNAETYEEVDDVFEMLNGLSDVEKEIVTLHVINELKFREVSDIIKMPLGTVLWHYQKAMTKLKQTLGETHDT